MSMQKSIVESRTSYNVNTSDESENVHSFLEGRRYYLFMKRLIDIFGSLVGIIFLSPVELLIALAIKIENPNGKVIFKQCRVGKDGKPFYIYKYRSMVPNAEKLLDNLLDQNDTTGPMFKMKEDPRVTRVGRFIRKRSLDELPQLFNVLKGDMSLVGPRPPLPREVISYSNYDKQRLLVIPGCTGLWQVSGRSAVGFDRMVTLDLEYIKRRSIVYDLFIILKTVKLFLGSRNAF
jgi:Sugar transferases involved in lipopolysaccharide synthesis